MPTGGAHRAPRHRRTRPGTGPAPGDAGAPTGAPTGASAPWPPVDSTGAATDDGTAIVVIRRLALQDLARAHTVLIDGVATGKIWVRQRRTYPVAPGLHTLQLRIGHSDLSESALFSVHIPVGTVAVFRTTKLGWKKILTTPLAMISPERFAARPWIRFERES